MTPGCKSHLRNVRGGIGSFVPRSGPSSVSVYLEALDLTMTREGARGRWFCSGLGARGIASHGVGQLGEGT